MQIKDIGDIMIDMSGYEITDEDVKTVVGWLKTNCPDSATEEYAREMLLQIKMKYRKLGFEDPDALENIYKEFTKDNKNT